MSRFRIEFVVFFAGLAAICWIAAGYLGSNPLALAVTLLIGACYVAGALELRRYSEATATLARAVDGLAESQPAPKLAVWLDALHPSLRNAVRLRVEGERVALPGPALAPYLVGLLVLLGMLGTLLGMVATLRGTGLALESATDLQAIRASLAAPVKGLGFAFGTSIAGVAGSAMLGLLAALCRRERLLAGQRLDVRIATTLRIYSQAHQRDATFQLLEKQTALMPTLVDRLQAMMAAIEQQHHALGERQLASQADFHGKAEAVYTRLAASVERSLKESVADSARAASEALQPVMQATLAGLERESAHLRETVTQSVQRQLDGLSTGFESSAASVAQIWQQALAGQHRANEEQTLHLRSALEGFTEHFEQRSTSLVDGIASRLDTTANGVAQVWNDALARQQSAGEQLAARNEQALLAAAGSFGQHAATLLGTVSASQATLLDALGASQTAVLGNMSRSQTELVDTLRLSQTEVLGTVSRSQTELVDTLRVSQTDLVGTLRETQAALLGAVKESQAEVLEKAGASQAEVLSTVGASQAELLGTLSRSQTVLLGTVAQSQADLQTALAARDDERLTVWRDTLASLGTSLSEQWSQAGERSASLQQEVAATLAQTARDIAAQTQAHASKTLADIDRLVQAAAAAPQAAADLQADLASRDQQRLTAWTESLAAMAATLSAEWQQSSAQAASRQQEICDVLERTASEISAQTQAHASDTLAEIGRLVQAASEAPKAAAEVVAELRQKLSDSMVRDTAMLQERSRLLETLETLLDAVNHASTEQRGAVDALVATSADLLQRVGSQFADQVERESSKLGAAAVQVSGGAIEVASLGDAFGAAVHRFGESNDKLVGHLERIEGALDKSLARSDEQLAYYVAQAREVIDLSMLSQKQIVEELQQLAGRPASAGAEPA
ncbi:DUF802 domain-containing protein [Paraburkholderia sp. BCC1886]|uniref:DUF802 domain-containing protein n=1 Tax=Paraburkholderia sp. BCC1886 TaxID=2562670 RepID=UPI0011835EC4|nr:DUF802 domain-containing protein [Paraburkholderia sp. BCC1886]